MFDPENSGEVGYIEVKASLKALGLPAKKSQILARLRNHGVSQEELAEGGGVNFKVFATVLGEAYCTVDPMEDLLRCFQLFDVEGRGGITAKDLKKVAEQLGGKGALSEEELQAMIECFDSNRDGCIDEEEFARIMEATSLY